jgi:hypothetical protein
MMFLFMILWQQTKVCQNKIFELYIDQNTRFKSNAFAGYIGFYTWFHNHMLDVKFEF